MWEFSELLRESGEILIQNWGLQRFGVESIIDDFLLAILIQNALASSIRCNEEPEQPTSRVIANARLSNSLE